MVNICILPVSGGAFVTQLAALQHISLNNIIPDIFLASSGGNLSAYIASCSDMDPNMIEFNSSKLSSSIFLNPWSYSKLLSTIIGYFQGSLNNSGEGAYKFLNECFGEKKQTYEIWTGVYNIDKKKGQYFCNKESSILDCSNINLDLYRILPFKYCNHSLKEISDISLASASIPALVPPVVIEGDNCVDGGLSRASPLSIMGDSIFLLANSGPVHMFYMNPIDVDNINGTESESNNLLDSWKEATDNLVESITIGDRYSCIVLLEKIALSKNLKVSYIESSDMGTVNKIETDYSVLELYPGVYHEINITSFTGDDIVSEIRSSHKDIKFRFWYTKN